MPDSLLFDDTDDRRAFTAGNFAGSGALTLIVVFKPVTTTAEYRWLIGRDNLEGAGRFGIDGSSRLAYWDGTSERHSGAMTLPAADEWYLGAFRRAAGTTTGTFSLYRYSTSGWSHQAASGTNVNLTAWSNICYGNSTNETIDGNLLIGGAWDSQLSQATIETLELDKPSWTTAAPDEAHRFDTAGTITPFVGVGTQSTSVGATLDTGDAPSGWTDTAAGIEKAGLGRIGP